MSGYRLDGDIATVGITDHAQEGARRRGVRRARRGGRPACAVVETSRQHPTPHSPPVVEINQAVADEPTLVNSDAMGEGWFRLEVDDTEAFNALLDEAAFNEFLETLRSTPPTPPLPRWRNSPRWKPRTISFRATSRRPKADIAGRAGRWARRAWRTWRRRPFLDRSCPTRRSTCRRRSTRRRAGRTARWRRGNLLEPHGLPRHRTPR